jgi:signal transduction histidine kinase/DNA-binding response OmpR family regulator
MLNTILEHEPPAPKTNLIKVLLVEDNLPDAAYVEEMLPTCSYSLVQVTSLKAAREQSQKSTFDVVLLDLSLPDSFGLETFLSLSKFVPNVPIVILTGPNDENIAAEAIKLGAQDFVQKLNLNEESLNRIIRYSIERNKTEGILRESASKAIATAAYLKLALRSSHTGAWSWERATNKVHFDDQMIAMCGLNEGTNCDSVKVFLKRVHSDDRHRIASALKLAVILKEEFDVDYRVTWPDGTAHDLSAAGQINCDTTGAVQSMTGVCRDITRHTTAEQDAKRLVVLEKHEAFIATLTHDLKTPLIGANRILELFVTGQIGTLQDEQLKLLRMLQDSNTDMLGLIENLLGVYRYDEGTTKLTYVTVDVASLADACLRQMDAIAERAGINFISNFPPGVHTLKADSIALSRVLRNLLSNAMKFTRSGGSITVSGGIITDSYVLKVEDTGLGMPEEDVELLFQRYSQGAVGINHGSGSGLGLYLCRQLVEAHGGKISCISRLGEGTIFTVILPA